MENKFDLVKALLGDWFVCRDTKAYNSFATIPFAKYFKGLGIRTTEDGDKALIVQAYDKNLQVVGDTQLAGLRLLDEYFVMGEPEPQMVTAEYPKPLTKVLQGDTVYLADVTFDEVRKKKYNLYGLALTYEDNIGRRVASLSFEQALQNGLLFRTEDEARQFINAINNAGDK